MQQSNKYQNQKQSTFTTFKVTYKNFFVFMEAMRFLSLFLLQKGEKVRRQQQDQELSNQFLI